MSTGKQVYFLLPCLESHKCSPRVYSLLEVSRSITNHLTVKLTNKKPEALLDISTVTPVTKVPRLERTRKCITLLTKAT
jgi:hypothetical protein